MTSDFLSSVSAMIRRHRLLDDGGRVLVAVSGGADSVALLCALHALHYRCGVAHCNFHLRGEESDRDEQFVRTLCNRLQLPCRVADFDTRQVAAERGISIEMAARDLRYAFFEELRRREDYEAVAVAHHEDDNAETLLLNLVRGTGLHGLTGMKPKNGTIVRPLLNLSRTDILNYLESLHQPYINDSSNFVADVKRNVIRLQVMPLLKKLNPSVVPTLSENAERFSEAEELYKVGLQKEIASVSRKPADAEGLDIDTLKLKDSPASFTLLYELLSPYGFRETQLRNMLEGEESGALFETADWKLTRDRGFLRLRPQAAALVEEPLPFDTDMFIGGGRALHASFLTEWESIDKSPLVACLDADKLGSLTVRNVQNGDRFVPFGMKGSKLISDYLTDRKRSRIDKERALVVCSDGEIAWLVGERVSNCFAVTPQTHRLLKIELKYFQ